MQVDLTSGLAYEQAYYAQVCDLTFHIASSYTHTHACTHTCMRTHTQICTHAQPFYGFLDSVRDNTGELAPEETFTHSHLSWSSVIPCLLPPSFTIHSILLVQFMCLTVFFHNLSPSFLWSTSWPGTLNFILHIFLHSIIVFLGNKKLFIWHIHYMHQQNLLCTYAQCYIWWLIVRWTLVNLLLRDSDSCKIFLLPIGETITGTYSFSHNLLCLFINFVCVSATLYPLINVLYVQQFTGVPCWLFCE